MTAPSSQPHTYPIGPWRRCIPAFIFGPFLLGSAVAWILLPGKDAVPAGLLFIALLPFLFGAQWLIDRTRLEVSAEGVRLRQTGYTLETKWENIIDMRIEHGRDAFITRDPVSGKGQELLAATAGVGVNFMPLYDDRHRALIEEHRLIPVEAFAWHLRRGSLRSAIEGYAPHLRPMLAEMDRTGAPATDRLQPLNRRGWIVLLGITGLLGAIGWLSSRSAVHGEMVDNGFGAIGLASFAIYFISSGRQFLTRRRWVFASGFLVVGTGLALLALTVGGAFLDALGLAARTKSVLGVVVFAALTIFTVVKTRTAFQRRSIYVGVVLILLDLFFAMMALGLWIELSKT